MVPVIVVSLKQARIIWHLWNDGCDTYEIAKGLSLDEAVVFNTMRHMREEWLRVPPQTRRLWRKQA